MGITGAIRAEMGKNEGLVSDIINGGTDLKE